MAGLAKLLDGKCWASKIFQMMPMGHEGICLQYLTIVFKTFSIVFAALLIIGIVLHLNSNTVLSSRSAFLKTLYRKSDKVSIESMMHRKKIELYSIEDS